MKILAVDDDSIVLGLLVEILESAEYGEVQTCTSAERALEVIGEAHVPFECFMLDIQMRGMDGITLCARIREIPQYARTPILMLTAMSEKSFIDRAFAAGASDYLSKPIDPTEIVVRLGLAEQLMRERRSLARTAGVVDSLIDVLDRSTRYDLEDAIDLGRMDRLLRYPAFENYLYQTGRGVLFLSTVFAARIRNVRELYRKLPPLEFKNLLATAAASLIGKLDKHEAFITYRGEGEFVGVIPRKGQHVLKQLGCELVFEIEPGEGKHAASLPAEAKLVIGPAVPVRLPTRGELSKAIWHAVERVRLAADPLMRHETKTGDGHQWPRPFSKICSVREAREESLRNEFREMLRDQLNTEIGDNLRGSGAGAKRKPGAFMKRDSNALKHRMKGSTRLFPNAPRTTRKPAPGTVAAVQGNDGDSASLLGLARPGQVSVSCSNA
ncbi:MAG: hypothetical protein CSA74_09230 [Rhodobacterales bacterium]|nr:MAG: hypothetical protein CSA74_09230 [Rhodobacterales bacterium]